MSIKLQVEPYCQNCPNFEAVVEKYDFNGCDTTYLYDTTIACENAAQCQRMMEYLRNQNHM
mgnify:CR=1 FL=1